ncbi:SprT-like domain-containing protein [Desulfocicer niacini]
MTEQSGRVQEKLERQMVERLQYEWKKIYHDVRYADQALALRLTMPSIVLMDMKACLGQWVPDVQEIRLNRSLLMNGRWDSVCEVLRHEVAHQMASLYPEYQLQPPHGDVFKACCKKTNANPRASGTYQTLEQRVWEDTDNEPDRIMGKVKKLMGLAASKNRFEAAAAAAKANQLISRYNIDLIRHDKPRHFESIILTDPVLKRSQSACLAAVILNSFYFVETVWITSFVPSHGRAGYVLEITGTVTNIKIADYVFHYILQYAESSWREYKKAHPSCRSRSGYMSGVVAGFREKLDEQHRGTMARTTDGHELKALVAMGDKRLARHFQMRYPRMRTTSFTHSSASRSAYESGKEQGRNLNISKGITSQGDNSGRLIGQ